MSLQYNRRHAFIQEEGAIVRARLRDFSTRTRAVVEAAQTLSGKGSAPNSAAKLEAARSDLTFCLQTLLDLKRISFGPGPVLTDESNSSTTRRKLEIKQMKSVAADVQYVTWKLVEHAEREEKRHTKKRRALKLRQSEPQEPPPTPADQGSEVPHTGTGSGFAMGGAPAAGDVVVAGSARSKAGINGAGSNPDLGGGAVAGGGSGTSAAEVAGASAASPGYSSPLPTPSTGQAPEDPHPARHFMTLQRRAPKRVPAKKRKPHLGEGAVSGSGSGASAVELPGANAAAPGYSSSLSTPSTGKAAGNLQPARHFMTLQHRAPKRVPAKKNTDQDEPNAGTVPTFGGGTVAGDGIDTANAEGGGGGGGVGGDGAMGVVAAAGDGISAGHVRGGAGVGGGGGDVAVNGGAAGGDDGSTGHGGHGAGENGVRSDLALGGGAAAGGGAGAGIAEDGGGASDGIDFQQLEMAHILLLLSRQAAGAARGANGAGGAHTADAAAQQSANHQAGLESAGGGSQSSGFASGMVGEQKSGSNIPEAINRNEKDSEDHGDGGSPGVPSGPSTAAGTSGVGNNLPRCNDDPTEGEAAAPTVSATTTAGTSDGAPSMASIPVEGQQGMNNLKVGDMVEYRWGQQGEWYKCRLVLLQGKGTSREAELEFLPKRPRKSKGIRCCTGILKVAELVQDGDLALPGTHKQWD
eukprot:g16043.t1